VPKNHLLSAFDHQLSKFVNVKNFKYKTKPPNYISQRKLQQYE